MDTNLVYFKANICNMQFQTAFAHEAASDMQAKWVSLFSSVVDKTVDPKGATMPGLQIKAVVHKTTSPDLKLKMVGSRLANEIHCGQVSLGMISITDKFILTIPYTTIRVLNGHMYINLINQSSVKLCFIFYISLKMYINHKFTLLCVK